VEKKNLSESFGNVCGDILRMFHALFLHATETETSVSERKSFAFWVWWPAAHFLW